MADMNQLKATARPRAGKGAARQVRREGRIPAVIYGDKKEAETIALDHAELLLAVQRGKFTSTVCELDVEGRRERVLPRDVQLDPVRDFPIHVDFQRINAASRVRVSVPVRFVNDALSPGLKRGGVLNIVRHEIEVMCPAERIPQQFEINLEGLEIGRSIHISAVALPEGVTPTILNRDFTIATIAGAVKDTEAATTEAAAAAAPAAPAAEAKGAAPAAKAGAAKAPEPKAGGEKKK